MSSKWNWLRWIGILPVACASYLLLYGALNLFLNIFGKDEDGNFGLANLLAPAIASGAGASMFVMLGVAVAPSYKSIVALILMVICCLFAGMAIITLSNSEHKWRVVLEIIGLLVGSIASYINVNQKEKEAL